MGDMHASERPVHVGYCSFPPLDFSTMSAIERQTRFCKDLQELLEFHQAEFNLTDNGRGYGLHTPVLEVHMNTVYRDREIISSYHGFTLLG